MSNSTPRLVLTALAGLSMAVDGIAQDPQLVLEEVIVTAQKRAESLSDTPITVNVMTGEQIGELASFGFSDLSQMTAGLSISGSNFDTNIATRGLGTDLNAAVSPRVTTYFDGAFIGQSRMLFSGLYDLQQVELLRGPQGTLYGRSSPAGAITLRSTNPNVERMDGYIRQSFSDEAGSNTQIGASFPLIQNQLAIRVAGLYDSNEHSGVENTTLDKDLENETTAFRAILYWEPADNFDLRLSYHDIEDESDIDLVVDGNGVRWDDREAVGDFSSTYTSNTEIWILESNYTFGNDWVATLVYSQQDNEIRRFLDGDGTEVRSGEQDVTSPTDDEIYEVRLASLDNEFWDWTAGIYGQTGETVTQVFVDTYVVDPRSPFPLYTYTVGPAAIDSDINAYFLHNVFKVSDRDIVTLGLRYNDAERTAQQPFSTDVYLLIPGVDEGLLVQQISWDGVLPEDQKQSFDEVTGTLKYQRYVSDDVMAYASYDIGWREGSANISSGAMPPEFGAFDPEDSSNIEVGVKWGLWEGRGLFNLAFYYQIYEDFHYEAGGVEHNTPTGALEQSDPVINVDEVEVYGFDSDISVLISADWTLSAAISYNQTEFTDASDVPCTTGDPLPPGDWSYNTCNLEGERAGNLPEWSFNLISEYRNELPALQSEWYLRGLLNSETEYYSSTFQEDLDGYTTLDLFLGLRAAAGGWDVNLWVKNLTDETALLADRRLSQIPDYDANQMVDSGYTEIVRQLNPRTIGVTLNYHWGL